MHTRKATSRSRRRIIKITFTDLYDSEEIQISDIMKPTEMVQHVSRNGSKNMLCHFFVITETMSGLLTHDRRYARLKFQLHKGLCFTGLARYVVQRNVKVTSNCYNNMTTRRK